MVQTRSGRSTDSSNTHQKSSAATQDKEASLQTSTGKAPATARYNLRRRPVPKESQQVSTPTTQAITPKNDPEKMPLSVVPPILIPSRLGIPSSPHSPQSPCLPLLSHPHPSSTSIHSTSRRAQQSHNATVEITPESTARTTRSQAPSPTLGCPPALPPADEPLPWRWRCHQCSSYYRLSVTRRCLTDGHTFCTGSIVPPASRASKRRNRDRRACSSQFDYPAWKAMGMWRRDVHDHRETIGYYADTTPSSTNADTAPTGTRANPSHKHHRRDCWMECDYPSECRWAASPVVLVPVLPHQLEGLTSSSGDATHRRARGETGSKAIHHGRNGNGKDMIPRSHPTSWDIAAATQEVTTAEVDSANKRRTDQRSLKKKQTRGLDFWRPLLHSERGKDKRK